MTVEKDAINQAIVPCVYISQNIGYLKFMLGSYVLVIRNSRLEHIKTINLKSFLTLIGIKFRLQ